VEALGNCPVCLLPLNPALAMSGNILSTVETHCTTDLQQIDGVLIFTTVLLWICCTTCSCGCVAAVS